MRSKLRATEKASRTGLFPQTESSQKFDLIGVLSSPLSVIIRFVAEGGGLGLLRWGNVRVRQHTDQCRGSPRRGGHVHLFPLSKIFRVDFVTCAPVGVLCEEKNVLFDYVRGDSSLPLDLTLIRF